MEEILASIRRIIAEDGDTAPAAEAAAAAPAAAPRSEEILELTDVVEEDGTVVSLAAKKAAEASEKRPPPEPPVIEAAPIPTPPPRPESFAPPQTESMEHEDRLVSESTAAASVASLSQLAGMSHRDQPAVNDLPLGDVGRTLEEMVRELLRPMLRDWLDANLPPLVERLVQDEIQAMVREARRG